MLIYETGKRLTGGLHLFKRRGGMIGLLKRLEEMFAAAAFAEAGEHETARMMLGADGSGGRDNSKARAQAYPPEALLPEED